MNQDSRNAAKRLRELMKLRRVKTAELANAVGISIGTFYNICCGNSTSRRARLAISDFFDGVEIWKDVRPAERRLSFQPGDKTQFDTLEKAKEMAGNFRGYVKRRGTVVTFIRKVSLATHYRPARGAASALPIFELIGRGPLPTPTANLQT